jgi:hypothetical protein
MGTVAPKRKKKAKHGVQQLRFNSSKTPAGSYFGEY